ncbi:PREDICTED: uncharacterized protein LOC105461339 isoform X2 [Wasmannia auropunctata]|uniref:uncharacterized protein LOC105461339 isoform X2 n=1 Tax=Wasmannia auropunctata TaxID=64793 RepID=UPI0005F0A4A2|nr:PREDICTED: uncharacterized protein LOC105461339 isoform X2 [Wasmannia auropunctata]
MPQNFNDESSKLDDDSGLFCFKTSIGERDAWYVDSGASYHLTNNRAFYDRFNKDVCETIRLADGRKTKSEGTGDITLYCVRALTSRGLRVNFVENRCEIINGNTVVGTAEAVNGLFKLCRIQKALMTVNIIRKLYTHFASTFWTPRP